MHAMASPLPCRRLGALGCHLQPSDTGGRSSSSIHAGAAKLLTAQQVQSFIVDGFLVLTPDDDELPGGRHEFASEFGDKAREIAGYAAAEAEGEITAAAGSSQHHRDRSTTELWAALTPGVNTVLGARTTRGALTSLLGVDWVAPPGNSLLHVSQPTDQQFHKDGTDHGPTMSTVRDHRPRHVIVMFYPVDTTVDLGPTAVIPRTQYTSVDREGFHNSEERLSTFLRPPHGQAAHRPPEAWAAAHAANDKFHAQLTPKQADVARMDQAVALLGDTSMREVKVVVPAGSIVICVRIILQRHRPTTGAAAFFERRCYWLL